MDNTKTIYQFVTLKQDGKIRTTEFQHTEIPFLTKGLHESKSTRKELQMQPKFSGFCGPMWGGYTSDGKPIIRYESTEAYNALLNPFSPNL
ncbi:hypothetical protein CN284_26830 [Bacillus cereus]|nr:hypothetical protein CN284_26830 [Bacillus cereus]